MRPVLVVGAPGAGAGLLACALGQHPALELVWGEWEGRERWVDGSAEVTAGVGSLLRRFPDACVVHVIGDGRGAEWFAATAACTEAAERAGSAHALLLDELLRDPVTALSGCLRGVGEEWSPACLRPLRGLR